MSNVFINVIMAMILTAVMDPEYPEFLFLLAVIAFHIQELMVAFKCKKAKEEDHGE